MEDGEGSGYARGSPVCAAEWLSAWSFGVSFVVPSSKSFNGFWKLKNRDLAAEEIIRERRVAIMNGKLKGRRRLFKAVERETELGLDWNRLNMLREREVNDENLKKKEDFGTLFRPSCSFSGSSLSDEKVEISERVVVEGEKKVEVSVAEKGGASRNLSVGGGQRFMLALAWFAIIAMLFTIGLIISMSCSGIYVLEKEAILVPT
ncbi:unnamed protein product [Fraxinus pennsylvanica]|uniref:Uncharacterized protein n=1 Tax=Fraxinus pennsylvanica TaxID=56036 RepID=A0AAD1YQL0_9LAMI|nr:unnamed protein product [Fraxinus pennsylvanica]